MQGLPESAFTEKSRTQHVCEEPFNQLTKAFENTSLVSSRVDSKMYGHAEVAGSSRNGACWANKVGVGGWK